MTRNYQQYCTHTNKGQFCREQCIFKTECFLGLELTDKQVKERLEGLR